MPFDGLTDDQLRTASPAVFATHPSFRASDRYAYLPSYQVVREMRLLGMTPVAVRETKKRMPDGRPYAMHQITFHAKDHYARAPELGELHPEILFLNSHDLTSPLSFEVGLLRAVCTNGMRTDDEELGMAFKIRHTGKNRQEQLHAGMAKLTQGLDKVIETANRWSKIRLTAFQASQFATKALDLRGTALSVPIEHVTQSRRDCDFQNDLWHVFNRVQENIMKGGLSARTVSNRYATLKPVQSLAADIDFNRKLWAAASSLAAEIEPRSVAFVASV